MPHCGDPNSKTISGLTKNQESDEMTFSSNVLSIEINGPVGILWLDRPEKRNAMSHEM